MHLEGALADDRAMSLVLEEVPHPFVVDHAACGGDVSLLHRQDDVVLERLVVALDQHVVSRQAGTPDAEPLLTDDVLDVVEHFMALDAWRRESS